MAMAEELDDLEFLLPSELLTDDDLLTDFTTDRIFGFSSDLSSPVESVTGTTETESDELDFISELTTKGLKLSSSPQSTLCGFKPGSRGSPKSGSGVCSPPEAKEALDLELLYAAAGEVARLQMIDDTASFCSANRFAPPSKPGFYTGQSQRQTPHHSYDQFQAAKFLEMKQHQVMNNRFWDQGIAEYQHQNRKNMGVKSQGLSMSSWPTLQQSQHQQRQQQQQQQHTTGSGMRAVFIGDTGSKKERVGTGVFMPRRFGSNPTESRKKLGCSTVLIPDRVAQVLSLNMDSSEAQVQHSGNEVFTTDYDMGLKHKRNVMLDQQRRNLRPHAVINPELSLPQEWTY